MTASAGFRTVDLHEDPTGAPFPVVILYPSTAPEAPARIGPYTLDVARDGAIAPGAHPLVVISHGNGGSPLVYRALAAHLARRGFVVAMPEHPGNNRNDNALAGTAANLEKRPRTLRRVADWAFSAEGLAASLRPDAYAVIGHSIGGYTALAAAGGRPTALAHETPDQVSRPVEVTADARIKAIILFAPATIWFLAPGSLSRVGVPILMLTAEKDEYTLPGHAEVVKAGVPDPSSIDHREIAGAGHFAFLTPFPEAMRSPTFPPSQDPAGFDRARFQETMHAEVLAFLQRVM